MTLLKEVDDIEEFIKNRKPTLLNLFLSIMLVIAFSCLFFSYIEKTLQLDFKLKLIIIFCFAFLFSCHWYKKRKLPKFKTEDNAILFAFNKIDPKTKNELDILYKKIISNIKEENLKSKIKVSILPDNILALDSENVKKIREKSRAKVVIWGNAESGTIRSRKKDLILSSIRFTYETRLKEKGRQFFNQDISNVVLNKIWTIDETEQIIERDYLSRNIKIFSLYLIGWNLILSSSEGDRKNGVEILQQISKDYKKRMDLNNDEKLMVFNLDMQITLYYNEKIRNMNFRFTDKNNNEKIKIGRNLLNEIINSTINNKSILFECILDFLENKPKYILIEKLKKVVELTNEKDAPVFYSLAFVEYYNGDIKKGFKYLKKAIELVVPVDQMPSIVGWYEEALSENNDKKYLNFPIGQIYYNLLESADPQRTVTRESLSQFVADYKDNKDMTISEMVDEANKMLNKIKS